MGANTTIALADSQPTPVTHTFTPTKIKGDLATYKNYAASYALGQETLSLQLTETAKLRKVVMTVKIPRLIVESINGLDVPSAPDYGMVKIESFVPETWSQAAAEDLIEIAANLLKNSVAVAMVARGEFVY